MENLNSVWSDCLDLLQGEVSRLSFDTFIKGVKPLAIQNQTVYLQAENQVSLGYLQDRFMDIIRNAFLEFDSSIKKVNFVLNKNEVPAELETISLTPKQPQTVGKLKPEYSFDRFVIGENNRFACAACIAVAETPATKYNPLFVYGGVGLGKTHLMQAIGNYIIEEGIDRKVVYVSCENFTNEFISSIQNNSNNEFRNKYRSTDILLIDDIQFLAGKVETQEAFFHTFNTLYEANKQIVLTSDRPPKEIPKLEDRLRSRFEMGLMTDISTPSFETRLAILQKKAEDYDTYISDEILTYIAENIHSNIRELEGALMTVEAFADLHHSNPDLSMAKESLKDFFSSRDQVIDIPYIKKMVAKYYDVTVDELDSKSRTKKIVLPRQVAMYLSRELTDLSFPKIGESCGGRDHSTVVHACQKVSQLLSEQTEFSNLVETIKKEIIESTN